jgi:regulator of replication initiation timing
MGFLEDFRIIQPRAEQQERLLSQSEDIHIGITGVLPNSRSEVPSRPTGERTELGKTAKRHRPKLVVPDPDPEKPEATVDATEENSLISSLQGAELRNNVRSLLQPLAVLEKHIQEIEEARTKLLKEVSRLEVQRDECKKEAEELARKLQPYQDSGIRTRLKNFEIEFRSVLAENDRLRGENRRLRSRLDVRERQRISAAENPVMFGDAEGQVRLHPEWVTPRTQGGVPSIYGAIKHRSDRWSEVPSITRGFGVGPRASNGEIHAFGLS